MATISNHHRRRLKTAVGQGPANDIIEVLEASDALSAEEAELLDGVTAGTAASSKAVTLDSGGDCTWVDGGIVSLGSTTGVQFGDAGDKIGFLGATPVVQASAMTAEDATSVNSGDAGTDGVIDANRTRIGEIETALVNLGFIASGA